jgi:Mrp family chromosome partitioning ATPase
MEVAACQNATALHNRLLNLCGDGPGLASARNELLLTAGVLAVLAGLVVPLPARALDILLVSTMALVTTSSTIALCAKTLAELAGFPMLLVSTLLMRVALTAALSRASLLKGETGTIITGLGNLLGKTSTNFTLAICTVAAVLVCIFVCRFGKSIRQISRTFTEQIIPARTLSIETDLNTGVIDPRQADHLAQKVYSYLRFFGAAYAVGGFFVFDAVISLLTGLLNTAAGLASVALKNSTATTSVQNPAGLAAAVVLTTCLPAFLLVVSARTLLKGQFSLVDHPDSFGPSQSSPQITTPARAKTTFREVFNRCAPSTGQAENTPGPEYTATGQGRVASSTKIAANASQNSHQDNRGKKACRREEFYDNIISRIERINPETARSILLAAACPENLGVTTAVNVAMHFARRGQKCLLVDSDIARNAIARAFDIDSKQALRAPVKTCIENLYVWPAENFVRHSPTSLPEKFSQLENKFARLIIYAPNLASERHRKLATCAKVAVVFAQPDTERDPNLSWLRQQFEQSRLCVLEPTLAVVKVD